MANRHAIPHVMHRLMSKSVVERAATPSLYDFAILNKAEIERTLKNMGMALVVSPANGAIYARGMNDDEADAYAAQESSDPIVPWVPNQKLSYWESLAVLHFRDSLDKENRQGGGAIWAKEADVFDALARLGLDSGNEDRLAARKRLSGIAERLKDIGLLSIGGTPSARTFRGTALLKIAFTKDAIDAFRESIERTVAEYAGQNHAAAEDATGDSETTDTAHASAQQDGTLL